MSRQQPDKVILFDGVCNLCNRSVQFVIRHDPNMVFRYASLQSEFARKRLAALNQPTSDMESVIYIDGDKVYYKSDAALRIARCLDGAWSLLTVLLIIPRCIRDGVYGFIGKNRTRWFGRQESCMVPDPELKFLFLE